MMAVVVVSRKKREKAKVRESVAGLRSSGNVNPTSGVEVP